MPVTQLQQLARDGKVDEFETRCLELLAGEHLTLAQVVSPFELLAEGGQGERLATLAQMILDNVDVAADPAAALALAKAALVAAPKSDELRSRTVALYRQLYGQQERFDVVLQSSGLEGGRPVRSALKVLDLCLTLQPGDTLISRMDDRVVEVTEIDRANGLFTLRREGRATTRPAAEVSREYDRIAADDFRVVRQLRPESLGALIQENPLGVVIGLIHAHGGHIDADLLKAELVPKYIEHKDWAKWWTRARAEIKRSPNVDLEGRAPIILTYNAAGRTLESETWDALQAQREPTDWMSTVEGYLREKVARKEAPDTGLLARFCEHVTKYIAAVRTRRPGEALTTALVLDRLAEKGLTVAAELRSVALDVLREAADPTALLTEVPHEGLRERGFQLMQTARPGDWVTHALRWLPSVPAGLMDKIATAAIEAGQTEAVQAFVDQGLSDLAHHPELVYWLWKGPKKKAQLKLPGDFELYREIIDTVSALGRSVTAEIEVVKQFRERVKAALSLRDFDRVRKALVSCSEAAAITLRWKMLRLEGLGENTPARLLDILRDVHPQLWVVRPKELAPWADPEVVWTTGAGLTRRTAERDDIVNVKMRENAQKIGEAASHGDLSENAEYKFALEERDLLRARLAAINDELSRARKIEPHDVPEDSVGVGSRVTLRRTDDGTRRLMTFFGPFDTDVERGIYSYQAPVSQQLMGRRIGDRVTIAIDGQNVEYEVVAIENAVVSGPGNPAVATVPAGGM